MTARILIIEDHPDNMELMLCLLNAFGHIVLPAVDGEKGLDIARRELPDLILCDIHLPNMDGYGVLQHLKCEPALRRIPVIAITALAMVGDRQKVLTAGFDGYLGKPIEPELFVGQVEKFMRADLRSAPRTFDPDPAPPERAAQGSSVPHSRILVIDDMLSNREFIRCALEPCGHHVILASSAQNAMARARESDFDLILCDLHMPDEDGISFIRNVKADPRLQAIPFVFISAALANSNLQISLRQHGALHFIQRPVDPQTLIKEIEVCLRAPCEVGTTP